MSCPHEFYERESAVATEGLCPICMNEQLTKMRAALIHARTFLKTYQRSNAQWHNDRPTWDFIYNVLNPAIGDEDMSG